MTIKNKLEKSKIEVKKTLPKLEEKVNAVVQFLFNNPEISGKYDLTNFPVAKDKMLEDATEKGAENLFKSMSVEECESVKKAYIVVGHHYSQTYSSNDAKDALNKLIDFSKGSYVNEVMRHGTDMPGLEDHKKTIVTLPKSYKAYFDFVQAQESQEFPTVMRSDIQNTPEFIEMKAIIDALYSINQMQNSYNEIITHFSTPSLLDLMWDYVGSYFTTEVPSELPVDSENHELVLWSSDTDAAISDL